MATRHNPAALTVAGWLLTAVPVVFMGVGGLVGYLVKPSMMADGTARLGYPPRTVPVILALEVGAVLLYAVPQTAVLGAIVLTAYLGGAVASHVRVGEPQWVVGVVGGVVTWLGLYLRDPRVRALVPFRRAAR